MHDHAEFLSVSVVSARQCSVCGSLVATGDGQTDHQLFHDRIAELQLQPPTPTPTPTPKSSKKGKKGKKS